MKVRDFIEQYKNAKVQNTKINPNAISEYLKKELNIKTYIPFQTKRQIAEMILEQYIKIENGVKKYDTISAYVGFIAAMIAAHTELEWDLRPIDDYDLLAESGLLPQIIAEFKQSYDECDIILKMALEMELVDNNINILVGHFLDDVLKKLDNVGEKVKKLDLNNLPNINVKEEDLAKITGFLNKLK